MRQLTWEVSLLQSFFFFKGCVCSAHLSLQQPGAQKIRWLLKGQKIGSRDLGGTPSNSCSPSQESTWISQIHLDLRAIYHFVITTSVCCADRGVGGSGAGSGGTSVTEGCLCCDLTGLGQIYYQFCCGNQVWYTSELLSCILYKDDCGNYIIDARMTF